MSHRITTAEVFVALAEIDEHRAELARIDAERAAVQEHLARLNVARTRARDVLDAAEATTHVIAGVPVHYDPETGHVSPVVYDGTHRYAVVYRNVRTHRWNVRFEGRTRAGLVPAEFDTPDEAIAATAALFS